MPLAVRISARSVGPLRLRDAATVTSYKCPALQQQRHREEEACCHRCHRPSMPGHRDGWYHRADRQAKVVEERVDSACACRRRV
jgi:hypothetical protein